MGGGYAGMAAAVTLADAGVSATLFEAARVLGGRARVVHHQGLDLDNGQHLLLGAYCETLRLIRQVHPDPDAAMIELPLDLNIPGRFRFRAAELPAPLHVAWGLIRATGISLAERLSAAKFMARMRASRYRLATDVSVSNLLSTYGQSTSLCSLLWEPLCISALNTPTNTASGQVFLNVLRDALDGTREDSNLLLSRVSLTDLFPTPAAEYVCRHGGQVILENTVTGVSSRDGAFIVRHGPEETTFTDVICASSPHRAGPLLGDIPALHETAACISAFEYQPIYTIFLKFSDRVIMPGPMFGMEGTLTQWVFDRNALCGQTDLIAVVVSAEGAHRQQTQDAIADQVLRELTSLLGELPRLQWHRVIAEKRATFACTTGLRRPGNATDVPGFVLAGDYTASPYPATLETAVRSGIAAAHIVISR